MNCGEWTVFIATVLACIGCGIFFGIGIERYRTQETFNNIKINKIQKYQIDTVETRIANKDTTYFIDIKVIR